MQPSTELPSWAHPDLWIDADHALQFYAFGGETVLSGASFWHRRPDGIWCLGSFQWRIWSGSTRQEPVWQLVSMDPFHVEPSIHCHACGAHGWIRDGKWEPAQP